MGAFWFLLWLIYGSFEDTGFSQSRKFLWPACAVKAALLCMSLYATLTATASYQLQMWNA